MAQISEDCKIEMGINLAGISDFGREVPFVNVMKSSRAWYTKGVDDPNFQWDTGYSEALTYGIDGYPTHIPQSVNGSDLLQQVATVWDGTDGWPAGKYTLLWDGVGDFEFWGDYSNLSYSGENQYEFDFLDPEDGILQITMISSDIENPVSNMRLLMPGTVDSYETQPFNQVWLNGLEPFGTLRFMDWGHTNNWNQVDPYTWNEPSLHDWSERAELNDYTYSTTKGVPYELMVELMNQLDADGWVCIPHTASNNYISEMANLFRDNCEGDRQIYVEYSNEIWNWIFGQAQWLNEFGCVDQDVSWPEGMVPYLQNALDLWSSSFSSELDRITRVAAVQTSWLDVSERIVYNLSPNSFDVISPTFYFSFDEVSEGILDDLGSSATVADVAHYSRLGMPAAMRGIRDMKTLSDSLSKPLAFYEGGQHMTPNPFGEEPTYAIALLDIQRDTAMYNMYNEWLDSIRSVNDGNDPMLLMHFSYVSARSARYGSWGMLEYVNQDITQIPAPKFQAIIENIGCDDVMSEIKDLKETEKITLYPNPTTGLFRVKGCGSDCTIQVLDSAGNVFETVTMPANENAAIDVSKLPSGMYLVVIISGSEDLVSPQKLLKF